VKKIKGLFNNRFWKTEFVLAKAGLIKSLFCASV